MNASPPALETHDLTVAYQKKPVIYGVDIQAPAGQLIGWGPMSVLCATAETKNKAVKAIVVTESSDSSGAHSSCSSGVSPTIRSANIAMRATGTAPASSAKRRPAITRIHRPATPAPPRTDDPSQKLVIFPGIDEPFFGSDAAGAARNGGFLPKIAFGTTLVTLWA